MRKTGKMAKYISIVIASLWLQAGWCYADAGLSSLRAMAFDEKLRSTIKFIDQLVHTGGVDADIPLAATPLEGKAEVGKRVISEITTAFHKGLDQLGMSGATAEEVYAALGEKVRQLESRLRVHLNQPDVYTSDGMRSIVESAIALATQENDLEGLYLKEDAAKNLLRAHPPVILIAALGYTSVDALLEGENIYEVFSATRYVESEEWLGEFIEAYRGLIPDDFEKRPIRIMVFDPVKYEVLRPHIAKRLFMNNDKVVGTFYVMPYPQDFESNIPVARTFLWTLHYLFEIDFYGKFTDMAADNPGAFGKRFSRVIGGHFGRNNFFEPHYLQETISTHKTLDALRLLTGKIPELDFWVNTQDVGGYLPNHDGGNELVTFNLLCHGSNVSKGRPFPGNLLDFKQAVKTAIFYGAVGDRNRADRLVLENLDSGMVDVVTGSAQPQRPVPMDRNLTTEI